MESATRMNLSFDILGHIFTDYAKTETLEYPLETLLLVCRSWSDAALGHRAIWSHLNVHIFLEGHYPSIKIWRSRLPLRLRRCGDTVPLHVDLRHLPNRLGHDTVGNTYWEHLHRMKRPIDCPARGYIGPQASCTCVRETRLCIDEFLLLLAGQGGELCKRWSTLYLDLHNPTAYGVVYEKLGPILRYPMPILNSLTIHGDLHGEIFVIPDEASNIKELALEGSFRLPKSMPDLWRLYVAGLLYRPNNEVLQLPKLTHLALKNHGLHRLDALGYGKDIDISRVVSLAVHLDLEYSYSAFKTNVQEILQRSKNLTIIQGDPKGISMILKLVWETEGEWSERRAGNCERERKEGRLLAGQRITIEMEKSSAILAGDETCDQLCDVAAGLKVDLPNTSWEEILDLDMY